MHNLSLSEVSYIQRIGVVEFWLNLFRSRILDELLKRNNSYKNLLRITLVDIGAIADQHGMENDSYNFNSSEYT